MKYPYFKIERPEPDRCVLMLISYVGSDKGIQEGPVLSVVIGDADAALLAGALEDPELGDITLSWDTETDTLIIVEDQE